MPTPSLRALILDLGEVLVRSQPPDVVQAMADRAGVSLGALTAAYWAHRRDYDLHGDAERFWGPVLRDCESPLPREARAAALPDLVALDVRSWTDYREEVWTLAHRFRQGGGKLALLSNGIPEITDAVRRDRALDRTFDAVVVSYAVGVAKPERAIYELVLSRLGVAAGEALFVDDRAENIAGAAEVGISGLHFTGDASVAALAARLGFAG
jgi:putative hydrolase of the HAD superfamily